MLDTLVSTRTTRFSRHVERVVSRGDVTSQVEFGLVLGLHEYNYMLQHKYKNSESVTTVLVSVCPLLNKHWFSLEGARYTGKLLKNTHLINLHILQELKWPYA